MTKSSAAQECVADIFIYEDDKTGRIDTYQRCVMGADGGVTVASRPGDKILAAIVNPWKNEYEWSEISSFEALNLLSADMRDEDGQAPIMSGTMHFHAGTGNQDILEIQVSQMMAEIRINSIKCDFSSTSYSGAELENVSVYLANVNTSGKLFLQEGFLPEAPVNTECTVQGAASGIVLPEFLFATVEGSIGRDGVRPDIKLYCYPNEGKEDNPGSPFTRLVISGDILGQHYYYPMNINRGDFGAVAGRAGVSRNHCYIFDITLRRAGALTPFETVGPETVEISGTVKPWDEKDETEIEF